MLYPFGNGKHGLDSDYLRLCNLRERARVPNMGLWDGCYGFSFMSWDRLSKPFMRGTAVGADEGRWCAC
jgi:hypothetical protein